jgi:F420-0:gamma-glutamyl ligase-like protein
LSIGEEFFGKTLVRELYQAAGEFLPVIIVDGDFSYRVLWRYYIAPPVKIENVRSISELPRSFAVQFHV